MVSTLFDYLAEERWKQERLLTERSKNELPIAESGKEDDR
jgi:hypothetical protein